MEIKGLLDEHLFYSGISSLELYLEALKKFLIRK